MPAEKARNTLHDFVKKCTSLKVTVLRPRDHLSERRHLSISRLHLSGSGPHADRAPPTALDPVKYYPDNIDLYVIPG
jgi:hypothetical protein